MTNVIHLLRPHFTGNPIPMSDLMISDLERCRRFSQAVEEQFLAGWERGLVDGKSIARAETIDACMMVSVAWIVLFCIGLVLL